LSSSDSQPNGFEARITSLEKRVAQLKTFEVDSGAHSRLVYQYAEDKKAWEQERKTTEKLRAALVEFLALDGPRPAIVAGGKETISLTEKELAVTVSHEEKALNMTTATVVGKILFAGLTDLSKDGFSEAQLSECLKEHGWNVGHSTLAPTLGNLVRDGYLVRLEGKPAKYRLPTKMKVTTEG
jgi:hypothetical protein